MIAEEARGAQFKPTEKGEALTAYLEAESGRTTAITSNFCVNKPFGCGEPIGTFRDTLSEKEYCISGLCQACQDKIFGDAEDAEGVLDYGTRDRIKLMRQKLTEGLCVFDFTDAQGIILTLDLDKDYQHEPLPTPYFCVKSKSKGWHVYQYLGDECAEAQISLRSRAILLGSDPIRETLAWDRAHLEEVHDYAYLMFETPASAKHLRAWLATLPSGTSCLWREIKLEDLPQTP